MGKGIRRGRREGRKREGGREGWEERDNLFQQDTGTLVCQSGGELDGCHASLKPCLSGLKCILKSAFPLYVVQVCMCVCL